MNKLLASFALALLLQPAIGTAAADPDPWSQNMLHNPSSSQLAAEARGRVMIYDGFTDREVEGVMDNQFDRVQSMMFTGTIVTAENGQPMVDAETGEEQTEEDGCD